MNSKVVKYPNTPPLQVLFSLSCFFGSNGNKNKKSKIRVATHTHTHTQREKKEKRTRSSGKLRRLIGRTTERAKSAKISFFLGEIKLRKETEIFTLATSVVLYALMYVCLFVCFCPSEMGRVKKSWQLPNVKKKECSETLDKQEKKKWKGKKEKVSVVRG